VSGLQLMVGVCMWGGEVGHNGARRAAAVKRTLGLNAHFILGRRPCA